jgi:hypothetical protein
MLHAVPDLNICNFLKIAGSQQLRHVGANKNQLVGARNFVSNTVARNIYSIKFIFREISDR